MTDVHAVQLWQLQVWHDHPLSAITTDEVFINNDRQEQLCTEVSTGEWWNSIQSDDATNTGYKLVKTASIK